MVNADNQNIYGFFVLKEGNKNILNEYNHILFPENYKNHLYKVLYNKKEITKIVSAEKNNYKIEIIDHQLNYDNVIYLKNTNSFPVIDGYYDTQNQINNFKIIDKDNIQLKINIDLKFEGNSGELYILSTLKYDYYNVNEDLNFEFMHSTYLDEKEDDNHNKIYIFENINVDKKKYKNILKKIIPDLSTIINNELINIKKCRDLYQVQQILNKYYVKINELNEHLYLQIIEILKDNNKSLITTFNQPFNYETINYFYQNKEFFSKNSYFLNNEHFLNKEIIKYYGDYPYNKSSFDSIMSRYLWLKNTNDYGELYYKLLTLSDLSKSNNKNEVKRLENKLSQINIIIKNLEKNIKNEKTSNCSIYKFQAEKIDELNVSNKVENNYYFFDNKLYKFINNEFHEINNELENKNSINQIKNDDVLLLNNLELWTYKKNEWIFTNKHSNYNKIDYLCKFKNIDLENIKLDDLDCIYRKDYGCLSKTELRSKLKLEEYTYYKKLFENLIENTKSHSKQNSINDYIKEEKLIFINEHKTNDKIKKIDIDINNNLISKNPIDLLVKKIFRINDPSLKEYYFFDLIDKDCLLINNKLYSKKYKKEILCGHYYYLKKIYYSDNDDSSTKYIDQLIAIFSDNGENEQNSHTCKICGEKLLNNDFDETEGFAESGQIIMSREKWVQEKSLNFIKGTMNEYLTDLRQLDCNDEEDIFKKLLLTYGLDEKNIEKAINICNYIKNTLYPRIGITLPNLVFIHNIIEIIQKINMIPSFNIYKIEEINKLRKKGISKAKIEKFETIQYFENNYELYIEAQKQSIICSRILISIQVNIPNLIIKNKNTSCEFNGFNEKNGIDFFACILNELTKKEIIIGEDTLITYKNYIQENYNEFKKYYHIQTSIQEKKEYLLSLKKDKDTIIVNNSKKEIKFETEPSKININNKDFINLKNYKDFTNLYEKINLRSLYVSNEIINIINIIIQNSPLSDKVPSLLEKSCCEEDVSSYTDFYQYFQLFDPETKIYDYLEESKKLQKIKKIKLNNYCYHRIQLTTNDFKTTILNYPIVYDGKTTTEKFTLSVFKHYVSEKGEYKGTPRDIIEEKTNKITRYKDVKSGKYLDEIEEEVKSEEYSIDDLNDLLKSIEQNNMRFISDIISKNKNIDYYSKFENEFIEKMKKESINGLGIQINILVQNLTSILGKTKEYENNIIKIINNLFEIDIDPDEDMRKRINTINLNECKKLDFYKKIYQKIGKYLSIIKNFHKYDIEKKLNFIDEPLIRSELKGIIVEENNKLNNLLNNEIIIYFQNVHMKYNLSSINSIFGKKNILNKEGNKIFKKSNFTNNDAAILMCYIVIEQLNSFFEGYDNDTTKIKIFKSSVKNKYIAQFISIIIEEIEEYNLLFNICNKNGEFEHSEALFNNAYQLKILTSDQKVDMREFMQIMSESTGIQSEDDYKTLEEEIEYTNERKELIDEIEEKQNRNISMNDFKDELDIVKLKEIKDGLSDEDIIEMEEVISDGILKSDDALDSGTEYGSLAEFDFETGEDYSDTQYE